MSAEAMVHLFSTQCLFCAHEFTSLDRVWTHMYPHIIERHPEISMYQLGKLLNEFIEACKRQSSSTFDDSMVQAITNIFAVRVLALYSHSNGSGGRTSSSAVGRDLAAFDAGTSPEEPYQEGHDTLDGNNYTLQEATSNSKPDAFEAGGEHLPRLEQRDQNAHPSEPSERATTQMHGARFRICDASGMRSRRTIAHFSPDLDSMASGREEGTAAECSDATRVAAAATEISDIGGPRKRHCTLENHVGGRHSEPRGGHALSNLGQSSSQIGGQQTDTTQTQPGERNAMSVGGGIQGCEPGAQVSCPQEGQSPSRFPAGQPQAYRLLHELSWHAIWQLCLIRMKPGNLQRSGLADQLHQTLKHL